MKKKVFGPVGDIYNTHGGNYPGQRRYDEEPAEPFVPSAYTDKDFAGWK